MKICSKCGEPKDEDEFSKRKKGRDELSSRCKSCSNAYNKIYDEKNKEKKRKYNKAYEENNKEKTRKRGKTYRENNKEKIAALQLFGVEHLCDTYIKKSIRKSWGKGIKNEDITQTMIEVKRLQIQLHRAIKGKQK